MPHLSDGGLVPQTSGTPGDWPIESGVGEGAALRSPPHHQPWAGPPGAARGGGDLGGGVEPTQH